MGWVAVEQVGGLTRQCPFCLKLQMPTTSGKSACCASLSKLMRGSATSCPHSLSVPLYYIPLYSQALHGGLRSCMSAGKSWRGYGWGVRDEGGGGKPYIEIQGLTLFIFI